MNQILAILQKARKGEIKAGHKYRSRRRDAASGAWIYDYGHGQAKANGGEMARPELRERAAPTFLMTIDSDSIRSYMPAIPMLVPVSSWVRKAKFGDDGMVLGDIPAPTLPAHVRAAGCELGADGGGFVAARVWGGEYRFTPAQYTDWLHKVKPTWAAMLDFCVEPAIASTPAEVASRQDKTTANAHALWNEYKDAPWAWVPTMQGWSIEDYVRHARTLKPLIDEMQAHYGADSGFRVGIGTLCCRTSRKQIEAIVNAVAEELPGVPLHLWGVKLDAFKSKIALPDTVISSDSAAWSQRFGHDIEKYKDSGLSQREHAYTVALPDYLAKIDAAHAQVKQQPIPLSHELYDWQKLDKPKPEPGARLLYGCPACGAELDMFAWGQMEPDDRDDVRWHLELGVCPACQSPLSDDEYIPPHKLPAPDPDLDLPEAARRPRPAWLLGESRAPRKVWKLKKPGKMTAKQVTDMHGRALTSRMKLSRGSQLLVVLQKSRAGSIAPGHKYKERHKNKQGDWEYIYADPSGGAVAQHGFDFDAPAVAMVALDAPAAPQRQSTATPDAEADAFIDKLSADQQFDPRGHFALNLENGNQEYLERRFGAIPTHMKTKGRGFTTRGETDRYVWQLSYRGVFSAWKKQTPMPYEAGDSLREPMNAERGSYRGDIAGGSYELIARGRSDNGDLTPGDFNPAFEARHVEGVMNSLNALFRTEEGKELARAIDTDGHLISSGRRNPPHYMIIATDSMEDAGMGSAGIGSGGKVFWLPYTNQRGAPPLTFGLDPVYVLTHELHHSYGSGTEFDTFSSCLAIDYHLHDGNTLNPAGVKEEFSRMLLSGFTRERKYAEYVARNRAAVKWLLKRYPYQVAGLIRELAGKDYDSTMAKVKRW